MIVYRKTFSITLAALTLSACAVEDRKTYLHKLVCTRGTETTEPLSGFARIYGGRHDGIWTADMHTRNIVNATNVVRYRQQLGEVCEVTGVVFHDEQAQFKKSSKNGEKR